MTWTRRLSLAFIIAGIAFPLVVIGGTAALAPPVDAGTFSSEVVVGVQGPVDRGIVVALDERGEPKWTYDGAASYHDTTVLDNGSVLAAFAASNESDCGPYEPPCARTGFQIIDPEPEPHVVSEWTVPVRTLGNSEVHDVEVLPSGEVLVADMDHERILAVDPATGERTWTWNASQRYDAPPDPTREDWLHINDVDRIGPGEYLVSVRNANQLVVVNRTCTCVVEVVNEDPRPDVGKLRGDVRTLRGQHNPQWLGDGRVLVADSSNNRVVELERNATTGAWDVVWTLGSAGGIAFDWPRDADRLPNGHTLITDSRNNRIVEVDERGTRVASRSVPHLPYEADVVGVGEQPQGSPAQGPGDGAPGDGEGRIPYVSMAVVSLHHGMGLPYWFSETHVIAIIVGLLALNCGIGLRWLAAYRQ